MQNPNPVSELLQDTWKVSETYPVKPTSIEDYSSIEVSRHLDTSAIWVVYPQGILILMAFTDWFSTDGVKMRISQMSLNIYYKKFWIRYSKTKVFLNDSIPPNQ